MKVRSTLKEVAATAGVSPTTVSLYLNGATQVCSDETALRIRQAVVQLQYSRGLKALDAMSGAAISTKPLSVYGKDFVHETLLSKNPMSAVRPNKEIGAGEWIERPAVAVAVRPTTSFAPPGQRSLTIGVCLPTSSMDSSELGDPAQENYVSQIWAGASEVAEWEEFRLLSFPRRLRYQTSAEAFTDGSISGLVLEAGYDDPRVEACIQRGIPVVLLNRFLQLSDGCGAVYPLERDVVETAMDYLWQKGHRTIAHFGGPIIMPETVAAHRQVAPDQTVAFLPSDIATTRFERYQAYVRQYQRADENLVYCDSSWQGEGAREALEQWLGLPNRPSAVFCASDSLALALWDAAEEMGLRVPEDLSIIGVGDAPTVVRRGRPLTTIGLPGHEVGREAIRLLVRLIEGLPAINCRRAVPVNASHLIERGSVRVH